MTSKCYLVMNSEIGSDNVPRFCGWALYSCEPWNLTSTFSGSVQTLFHVTKEESYDKADKEMLRVVRHMAQFRREPWPTILRWIEPRGEQRAALFDEVNAQLAPYRKNRP